MNVTGHSPVWHRTAESVLSQKRNTNSFSVEDDISGLKRNRKYVIGFVSRVNAIRAVWDNWILLSKPNHFRLDTCVYTYTFLTLEEPRSFARFRRSFCMTSSHRVTTNCSNSLMFLKNIRELISNHRIIIVTADNLAPLCAKTSARTVMTTEDRAWIKNYTPHTAMCCDHLSTP